MMVSPVRHVTTDVQLLSAPRRFSTGPTNPILGKAQNRTSGKLHPGAGEGNRSI